MCLRHFQTGVSQIKKLAKRILEDFDVNDGPQLYEAEGLLERWGGLPWKNGRSGMRLALTFERRGHHRPASQHRRCFLTEISD